MYALYMYAYVYIGDPTQDEMLCFYKPPFWETHPADSAGGVVTGGCMRQQSKKLVREGSGASVGGKVKKKKLGTCICILV